MNRIKILTFLVSPLLLAQTFAGGCESKLKLKFFGATETEVIAKLASYYPLLVPEATVDKIQAAHSPFMLFRSFVPAFYELIAKDEELQKAFASLKPFTGWVAGDPHPENFGTFILNDSRSVFRFDDFDDCGPAPVYGDVLRFLSAVLLDSPRNDLSLLLKAYKKGLKNRDWKFSAGVERLIEQSARAGAAPLRKYYSPAQKALVRTDSSVEIGADLSAQLQKALTVAYGNGAVLEDAMEHRRQRGGSGGMKRFEVLVRFSEPKGPEGERTIIEFKQLQSAGVAPFASSKIPPAATRTLRSLALFVGNKASHLFSVQRVGDMDMLLRPKWEGGIGALLTDFSLEELPGLFTDEAYLLGCAHRESLQNPKAYLKEFKKVDGDDWERAARRVSAVYRILFEELHP